MPEDATECLYSKSSILAQHFYNMGLAHSFINNYFITKTVVFSILTEIAELRSKFEEDKQKIALMKMARKFKPF